MARPRRRRSSSGRCPSSSARSACPGRSTARSRSTRPSIRTTGGFAGLFDPADRRIEIAYTASDGVVLHELAHAWFNGRLVADRWAAEGFASYYAELAADELGDRAGRAGAARRTRRRRDPAQRLGPERQRERRPSETYAYAASLSSREAIAKRAGPDGLRAVWSMAEAGSAPTSR